MPGFTIVFSAPHLGEGWREDLLGEAGWGQAGTLQPSYLPKSGQSLACQPRALTVTTAGDTVAHAVLGGGEPGSPLSPRGLRLCVTLPCLSERPPWMHKHCHKHFYTAAFNLKT